VFRGDRGNVLLLFGRGVITIGRGSFCKSYPSLVRSRSINLGVRDREGVFTAASRRPCRADTTVADSNLADLTHADPINAGGPLADEALAEVWNRRAWLCRRS
jgi:hypothetical protein